MTTVLGIDIGGSGIKASPVDTGTGVLTHDRLRIDTPKRSNPEHVLTVVHELVDFFQWKGSMGITFPGVVLEGVVCTAANLDDGWIGFPADDWFSEQLAADVTMINDADAAGVAEMRFGAGRGRTGVVLMVTLGTGIGSALFVDGVLVPNTELGHLEVDGVDAESRAAARVRDEEDLSWKQYAARLDRYLHAVEDLLWPSLIIIGGGVSRKADKFLPHLSLRTEVVPATLGNDAGIVGAALVVG